MELKFLLIADTANATPEGKLNIAGEFNTIYAERTPASWPLLSIVARLEANAGEGLDHAAQVRLTDDDGGKVFETPPLPIKFAVSGRGIPARANVIVQAVGLTFPKHGNYSLHLLVDGVSRGDLTIFVRERPPAPGGAPGGRR